MSKHKKRRRSRGTDSSQWCKPQYNVHHRLPKSRGGCSDDSNLSRVLVHHHEAFNTLFGGNPKAHEVAQILSDVWIDPMYEIIVRLRVEPEPEL
jgi:hypothetical protein